MSGRVYRLDIVDASAGLYNLTKVLVIYVLYRIYTLYAIYALLKPYSINNLCNLCDKNDRGGNAPAMPSMKSPAARPLQLQAGLPSGESRQPSHRPRLARSSLVLVLVVEFDELPQATDGTSFESAQRTGGTVYPLFCNDKVWFSPGENLPFDPSRGPRDTLLFIRSAHEKGEPDALGSLRFQRRKSRVPASRPEFIFAC